MKTFFDIEASVYTRWFLGSPLDPDGREVDPRIFTQGRRVEGLPPLTLPIARAGDVVDFNLAAFDMPVVRRRFNQALEDLVGDAIQRIPITVNGKSDEWEILNVCKTAICVDEVRTEYVMKWTEHDHRSDKAGQYRMLGGMKIDSSLVQALDIFRIENWRISIICSERVRFISEDMNIGGICFEQVS